MSGGGEKHAIFFQKSKALQNEFMLINVVTVREAVRGKLEKLIRDIKMNSRVCDEACQTELFNLVTSVREATYDLLDSVAIWQQGFTKNIRPQLLNIDYLCDMVSSLEFVSATHLRRTYSFQLGMGNFMLLPLPTVGKSKPPTPLSRELCEALHNFGHPCEHKLVKAYTILLNCMSQSEFKKIFSIDHWMHNRWKPNIVIRDYYTILDKKEIMAKLMRGEAISDEEMAFITGKQRSSNKPGEGMSEEEAAKAAAQEEAAIKAELARKVALAKGKPLPPPYPTSPIRREGTIEIPNPEEPGEILALLEKKELVFEPGISFTAVLADPLPQRHSSPVRPSRLTREESPERIAKVAAKMALESEEDAIFSDDSEDERIKLEARRRKAKKPLYKRPVQDGEGDGGQDVTRGRREKPLAEPKTIEEKAARMSINTTLLRESWLGGNTSVGVGVGSKDKKKS
jgi:hypothetical protein